MKITRILLSGLMLSSFFASVPAWSDDFYLSMDSEPRHVLGVVNGDAIKVMVNDGRSYCCAMMLASNVSPWEGGSFASFVNFGSTTPTYRGDETPRIIYGEKRRACWAESENLSKVAIETIVLGEILSSVIADFTCEETTLYGNYNTSVSEFNFLEISARSDDHLDAATPITGRITLRSSITGNRVDTPFQLTFSEATGRSSRRDYSVHDLLGGVADFGEVIINHDGAPGQLTARLSQYDVTSTSPLNFTLVGHADLRRGLSK